MSEVKTYMPDAEFASRANVSGMEAYLQRYVYGPKTWTEFLAAIVVDELLKASRAGLTIYDA